jgi:hypothetical protein
MIVLMVLLCGPYGLAVMWVNGGYARKTRQIVTAVWAVFAVLVCAGAAMTMKSQILGLATSSAGIGSLPGASVVPTPRVFPGTDPAAKPSGPIGVAPPPPSVGPSPGLLPPGGGGTVIGAAPTAAPNAPPSPTAVAQNPDADSNAQKVKVKESDGTSVNLRDKPGTTGAIVKSIPEGTVLDVIGEDRQMDGKAWKNVKDETGATGWMAAELLEPA